MKANLRTVSTIIRVVVSLSLLVGVYSETGPWTTIACGLVFLASELNTFAIAGVLGVVKSIVGRL